MTLENGTTVIFDEFEEIFSGQRVADGCPLCEAGHEPSNPIRGTDEKRRVVYISRGTIDNLLALTQAVQQGNAELIIAGDGIEALHEAAIFFVFPTESTSEELARRRVKVLGDPHHGDRLKPIDEAMLDRLEAIEIKAVESDIARPRLKQHERRRNNLAPTSPRRGQ